MGTEYIDIDDFRQSETVPQDFEFPSVVLSNVVYVDALDAIKLHKKESNRTFPVWLKDENGVLCNIGTLNITFEMLNLLRILEVDVTLYLDADTKRELDLTNPYVLEEFI